MKDRASSRKTWMLIFLGTTLPSITRCKIGMGPMSYIRLLLMDILNSKAMGQRDKLPIWAITLEISTMKRIWRRWEALETPVTFLETNRLMRLSSRTMRSSHTFELTTETKVTWTKHRLTSLITTGRARCSMAHSLISRVRSCRRWMTCLWINSCQMVFPSRLWRIHSISWTLNTAEVSTRPSKTPSTKIWMSGKP